MKKSLILWGFLVWLVFSLGVHASYSDFYPDTFLVEVTPDKSEENQFVSLKITAQKKWKVMNNYEWNFSIWVENLDWKLLQSSEAKVPDSWWWNMGLQDKWVVLYENKLSISKKWTYRIVVSEFTDDNISWSAMIKIFWDDSWLKELTTYSQEYIDAYNWAYWKSITTQSIDKANLDWSLTRQAMAKMIVVFSKDVLWLKPDSSKSCTFDDVKSSSDLAPYIKQACQLWLMWQWVSKFNPSWEVTRAQFWTILSRAIWGSKNDWGEPYYKNHLNMLKSKGIMSKIENADSKKEMRGNVMIMLKRASENNK